MHRCSSQDVDFLQVSWSSTGSLVVITAKDLFYILRFNREAYTAKLEEGAEITDEGVEKAFEVVADVSERYIHSSNFSNV
jgi:coatomer subunit beta'